MPGGRRGLTRRPRAPRVSHRHARVPRVSRACDRAGGGIRVRVIAAPRAARRRPPPPVGRSPPSRPVASSPCAGAAAGRGAGTVFSICGSCWRGQAYCGAICRETAQRLQGRRSSAKHQRSPEGRLDHRDRQRVYRAKCRLRVTQAPSPRPPRSPTIAPPVRHAGIRPVCRVCGRVWATRAAWRGPPARSGRAERRKAPDDGDA